MISNEFNIFIDAKDLMVRAASPLFLIQDSKVLF
jgi:hypothetical protein